MNIAVLGTGMVGQALAGRLHELGHTVAVGTRDPQATLARTEPDGMGNPPFATWHATHPGVALATFADAAARRRAGRAGHQRRRLPRGARPGRRREPGRQGAARHLQPARLLRRASRPPCSSRTPTRSASRSSGRSPTPRWSSR